MRNVAHVTNACVTELLSILNEEGRAESPRTGETILGTTRHYSIESMYGNEKEPGEYIFLGLQNQLAILPQVYTADTMRISVNIDGMPLFNRSGVSLWPILIQLCDVKFEVDPLMVGAFCGVTKPQRVDDYLKDFAEEADMLI